MKAFSILSLSAVAVLCFSGCEKEEPRSYLIPKEDRSVSVPVAPAAASNRAETSQSDSSAPQVGPSSGNRSMQILPGMKEAADEAGQIEYTVPEGWEELEPSGIRKVNLAVSEGSDRAELTVLVFPGDVGGRLANINRWRGQVGLSEADPDTLRDFTESYTISNHRGLYVTIEGEENSILGGLLPFHGFTWFFKLQGPTELVLENDAKMREFLDSIVLEDDHH